MYKISILVISRTSVLLNELLNSILHASKIDKSYIEILCSWNGSNQDYLSIQKNIYPNFDIQIIEPYHFASNMNLLISRAKGEYILLVNDDVLLDPGSIDKAIEFFETSSEVGLLGGNLRDRRGTLMHCGLLFNIFHLPYHFLEGLVNHDNEIVFSKNYKISAVTGALMLTKTEIIKDLRFNPKYKICGEDIELCLDIREKFNLSIFYTYGFSGIHESETTRKITEDQNSSLKDKFLISTRYLRFILRSSIDNLIDEYKFNKMILYAYSENNIDLSVKSRNYKWNMMFWIFIYYLKILILLRKNIKNIFSD